MYGSQLIAVETQFNDNSVSGVSDSKVHAESLVAAESSPKPTPPTSNDMMSPNVMMSTTSRMPTSSKKPVMTEKSESGTNV